MAPNQLSRRQQDLSDGSHIDDSGAEAIRYVVVVVIVLFLLIFIFGTIWHANRRARRGQAPLFYHKWFLRTPRRTGPYQPTAYNVPPSHPQGPAGEQQYPLNTWSYAPPPPAYAHDELPKYEPPSGPPPGFNAKDSRTSAAITTLNESSNPPSNATMNPALRAPEQAHTNISS